MGPQGRELPPFAGALARLLKRSLESVLHLLDGAWEEEPWLEVDWVLCIDIKGSALYDEQLVEAVVVEYTDPFPPF